MMMHTTHFAQEHATHTIARYHREATIARALRAVGDEPRPRTTPRNPLSRLTLAPRT